MRLAMEMNKASHPVLYLEEVVSVWPRLLRAVALFPPDRIQRRARASRWKQEPDGRRDKGAWSVQLLSAQARPCS